ncbi:CoA-acylating methylmalonate-semialdehyde dehydrogenase [Ruania alkalisoli]|uniref:methylmalonate-semialdehyde dehydrogenase (CoA acylating) n=1 Tax=Ruania alkalisoli TaxID=2779775 RepID=A0A7M1SVY8_9MICO|nr:CoA-acylating methylmalonate-semialdehyde dehydrogenase [Ruania alkalisoli]QOR71631.1 CoA-acylating methylmalonate-semialdehyde dehydrogenase [Ruania alkalisoli]
MNRLTQWVDGAATAPDPDAAVRDVLDPATGGAIGQVELADAQTVDRAVTSAHDAWRQWRTASLATRTRVLFSFRNLLLEHRDEIAGLITAENGKELSDAKAEITRGLDVVELACGIGSLLKGERSLSVSTGVDVSSVHQPLGVVGVISPFNFPAMVPLWFVPIAIACGNAVVLKPSEKVPAASMRMAELWQQAGLPDGALTVVNGEQEAVEALIDHDDVASISFVGSTPVARAVYARAAVRGKRVQALGGAKNHLVVLPDADVDLAADAAVSAAFGAAGQRCMAISVAVAVGEVGDRFVEAVAQRARSLRVGDGRRGNDLGPLITREHRDRVASLVEAGVAAGARAVVDGREVNPDGDPDGFWFGPTVLDHVEPAMSAYAEEIFGPVLCVVRAETAQQALDLVNASPYGNGAAVFTRDGSAAAAFERTVEAGMVGVNVPIPVPVAPYSFGGWKDSLFGDSRAYGAEGVRFFTRSKVVTSRWPTSHDAGLELGFPQAD